jgi:hypothetical protein
MVNRIFGDPASQLRERHEASDFDTKTQDKVAQAGGTGGGLRGGPRGMAVLAQQSRGW